MLFANVIIAFGAFMISMHVMYATTLSKYSDIWMSIVATTTFISSDPDLVSDLFKSSPPATYVF